MLFKFLEKPINLTAFVPTTYSFANEYSPIKPASRFIPNWYKNLPKTKVKWNENSVDTSETTVKQCIGIQQTFQNGFILPLWSDLMIKIGQGTINWQFSDAISKLSLHSNEQLPIYSDFLFLKIESPWIFSTSSNLKVIYCDPIYFTGEKTYFSPYGVNMSMSNMFTSNCFLFLKKEAREILIKHNTPLLHMIPLTDRKINFKTEVISHEEYTKLTCILGTPFTFNNKGLNILKILRNQKNG